MKKALISGVSGQDGSYLAELLLEKGYEVHGVTRRVSVDSRFRMERLDHIMPRLHMISASVENYASIFNAIESVQPDEIYHLAAQSFVQDSFKDEFTTMRDNVDGTHNVLSIVKTHHPKCRLYFAGSSEMFGKVLENPQKETTPFNPRSIYGISKCAGAQMVKHYRDAYGIHASCGILYNHESPRRGVEFVTRKVCRYAARIKHGLESYMPIGNLEAKRDWGHARDYVEAMYLMLQQEVAGDYVVATGITKSVHELCKKAFDVVGLDCDDWIKQDENCFRPSEVDLLLGDSTKARMVLGWEPKTGFDELIEEMVESELKLIK